MVADLPGGAMSSTLTFDNMDKIEEVVLQLMELLDDGMKDRRWT